LKTLNVGDRVAVYDQNGRWGAGTVVVVSENLVKVRIDLIGAHYWLHKRFAKKLRPKRKRIEGWVNVYPDGSALLKTKELADSIASSNRVACIKVREVKEKK
jgi:hypothetical protein